LIHSPTDKVDDLESVSFLKAYFRPAASRSDVPVQLDRHTIAL